ncbi:MAG: hypothetical protein II655_05985, partial [Thermoguttaceae bacterium]|nr:hypothetical protein [Thermoguttaceae bacterium]
GAFSIFNESDYEETEKYNLTNKTGERVLVEMTKAQRSFNDAGTSISTSPDRVETRAYTAASSNTTLMSTKSSLSFAEKEIDAITSDEWRLDVFMRAKKISANSALEQSATETVDDASEFIDDASSFQTASLSKTTTRSASLSESGAQFYACQWVEGTGDEPGEFVVSARTRGSYQMDYDDVLTSAYVATGTRVFSELDLTAIGQVDQSWGTEERDDLHFTGTLDKTGWTFVRKDASTNSDAQNALDALDALDETTAANMRATLEALNESEEPASPEEPEQEEPTALAAMLVSCVGQDSTIVGSHVVSNFEKLSSSVSETTSARSTSYSSVSSNASETGWKWRVRLLKGGEFCIVKCDEFQRDVAKDDFVYESVASASGSDSGATWSSTTRDLKEQHTARVTNYERNSAGIFVPVVGNVDQYIGTAFAFHSTRTERTTPYSRQYETPGGAASGEQTLTTFDAYAVEAAVYYNPSTSATSLCGRVVDVSKSEQRASGEGDYAAAQGYWTTSSALSEFQTTTRLELTIALFDTAFSTTTPFEIECRVVVSSDSDFDYGREYESDEPDRFYSETEICGETSSSNFS